jgi:hypothetical protein
MQSVSVQINCGTKEKYNNLIQLTYSVTRNLIQKLSFKAKLPKKRTLILKKKKQKLKKILVHLKVADLETKPTKKRRTILQLQLYK